jgi:hypothetical protein
MHCVASEILLLHDDQGVFDLGQPDERGDAMRAVIIDCQFEVIELAIFILSPSFHPGIRKPRFGSGR